MRVDALRLRGPAVETIKLEAELDATDQLEFPQRIPHRRAIRLATATGEAWRCWSTPRSRRFSPTTTWPTTARWKLSRWNQPLTLFVWSRSRVVPVRITDFSITEEAFDPSLNPIRAKVSLGLRVLNVDDLGFSHPGSRVFMTYLSSKEQLAKLARDVSTSVLGLGGLT